MPNSRFFYLLALLLFLVAGAPCRAEVEASRRIAIVLASDGSLENSVMDFYRAVFQAVDTGKVWTPVPIQELRTAQSGLRQISNHNALPTIPLQEFKKALPRRNDSKKRSGRVPSLQSLLDTLVVPMGLVVNCQFNKSRLISSCGLYIYDRASGRVRAASVKKFSTGINDASAWAVPMLQILVEGLQASQRAKDQALIDELVARQDQEDEEEDVIPFVSLVALGERLNVPGGDVETAAGYGVQLGFRKSSLLGSLEYGQLTRNGDPIVNRIQRQRIGLRVGFQAKALENLLWTLELGASQQITRFNQVDSNELEVMGISVGLRIGVGMIFSENFQFDIGPAANAFYEQSLKNTQGMSDVKGKDPALSGVFARLLISY